MRGRPLRAAGSGSASASRSPTRRSRATTPTFPCSERSTRLRPARPDVDPPGRGGGARTDLGHVRQREAGPVHRRAPHAGARRHRPRDRHEHRRRGRPRIVQDTHGDRRVRGRARAGPPWREPSRRGPASPAAQSRCRRRRRAARVAYGAVGVARDDGGSRAEERLDARATSVNGLAGLGPRGGVRPSGCPGGRAESSDPARLLALADGTAEGASCGRRPMCGGYPARHHPRRWRGPQHRRWLKRSAGRTRSVSPSRS